LVREYTILEDLETARSIATQQKRRDINKAIAALPGNNAILGGKKL